MVSTCLAEPTFQVYCYFCTAQQDSLASECIILLSVIDYYYYYLLYFQQGRREPLRVIGQRASVSHGPVAHRSEWLYVHLLLLSTLFSTGEKRTTACGRSDGLRVPLTCNPSQWLHIFAEQYSAAPLAGNNCTVIRNCQSFLSSHASGLAVSCNGPVGPSGVCEEETEARKWLRDCMTGSETAAVEVRYECLPGQCNYKGVLRWGVWGWGGGT